MDGKEVVPFDIQSHTIGFSRVGAASVTSYAAAAAAATYLDHRADPDLLNDGFSRCARGADPVSDLFHLPRDGDDCDRDPGSESVGGAGHPMPNDRRVGLSSLLSSVASALALPSSSSSLPSSGLSLGPLMSQTFAARRGTRPLDLPDQDPLLLLLTRLRPSLAPR